jgi:hypothetical protein
MQDVLATEQEDHKETRESVNAFNARIQVFMTVRNNNTFIADPMFFLSLVHILACVL